MTGDIGFFRKKGAYLLVRGGHPAAGKRGEVVSSGSCRVVGNRGSAVRGKWAEIFRGAVFLFGLLSGRERDPEGCEREEARKKQGMSLKRG